jgi:RND family efflux transporter MFP subunit
MKYKIKNHSTMKIIRTIPLIAVLLFTISCSDSPKKDTELDKSVAVQLATPVYSETDGFSASGTVKAVQGATISTRTMGYVESVEVQVGNRVRKGTLLIRINNADLTAQLAQADAGVTEAEAALANVEKNYTRFKELYKTQSVTSKEMDDMNMNLEMSKSRLKAARQMRGQVAAQLNYTDIRAPFDGLITGKFINEGDMANPGMPLLGLENTADVYVETMIPESNITGITKEMKATISIKSTGFSTPGTVVEVSHSAKHTGGQFLVKVVPDTQDTKLLPGMFASVHFERGEGTEPSSTLVIQRDALVERGQLSGVYTVTEKGKAQLRWLRLGKTFGEQVEVLSGLKAGEKYVLNSESKLYNGITLEEK